MNGPLLAPLLEACLTAGSVDGVSELCVLPLAKVVLLGVGRRLRGLHLPTSAITTTGKRRQEKAEHGGN